MWFIHTVEYYLALKEKKETLIHPSMWGEPRGHNAK